MMAEQTQSNQTEATVAATADQPTTETTPETTAATTTPPTGEGRQNGAAYTEVVDSPTSEAVVIESAPESPTETMVVDPAAADKATIAALQAELAAAEAKNADLVDKLQRTAAEFQNSRRRQEKQLADEIERASGHIVQQLLPVVDDLELAFANVPVEVTESSGAWLEGFRQIRKKLDTLLEDRGVVVIAKEGPFDPMRHEAISNEPSEEVESGHIIQTLRAGYEHKGRVLRPALVRVAM